MAFMSPEWPQRCAQYRQYYAAKNQIPQKTIDYVEFGVSLKWSPLQISGVSRQVGLPVSHEWIYGYVQTDRRHSGKLYSNYDIAVDDIEKEIVPSESLFLIELAS